MIDHSSPKSYRFAGNPLEKRFSENWEEVNTRNALAWLMGDGSKMTTITQAEATAAAAAIQWLGSPIGQCFLARVLKSDEAKHFVWRLNREINEGDQE